eukprot:SAG31_NODE_3909_length_3762_cov_2.740923_4_plen_164_part_00
MWKSCVLWGAAAGEHHLGLVLEEGGQAEVGDFDAAVLWEARRRRRRGRRKQLQQGGIHAIMDSRCSAAPQRCRRCRRAGCSPGSGRGGRCLQRSTQSLMLEQLYCVPVPSALDTGKQYNRQHSITDVGTAASVVMLVAQRSPARPDGRKTITHSAEASSQAAG